MNDILAAFGIDEKDFKNAKKETKKKNTKTSSKRSEKTYSYPVQLHAGHLHCVIEQNENDVITESNLKQTLRDRFRELKGILFDIIEMANDDTASGTKIRLSMSYQELKDEEILEFPLEVVVGEYNLWIDTKHSLEEITMLWVQEHPEYEMCKFHYDEKQRILLPFMQANVSQGMKCHLPITVGYLDQKKIFTSDDFGKDDVSLKEIYDLFKAEYSEFEDCEFAYIEKINLLFPITKDGKSSKQTTKTIALPVDIKAGGFQIVVKEEDFGGKKSVTLEEIREVLEKIYPEYAKERTEMIYDNRHFVIPILKSSKKGLEVLAMDPSYKHAIWEDEHGISWRMEERPYGTFLCRLSDGLVSFQLKAKKVPKELLKEVIRIFQEDASRERAIQLFYDKEKDQYELYEPVQKTTMYSVVFHKNAEIEKEKVLVMDIHSHGKMSAFFSAIDDKDEKGVMLYMVVGNLDHSFPKILLRAGVAGKFAYLNLYDIFEM